MMGVKTRTHSGGHRSPPEAETVNGETPRRLCYRLSYPNISSTMLHRTVLSRTTRRLVSSTPTVTDVVTVPQHFSTQSSATNLTTPHTTTTTTTTKETIRSLFHTWNKALATGNPDTVTAMYTTDAVLLPTVSDTPRTSPLAIRDYFLHFLQNKPHGSILESHVQVLGDTAAQDVGLYEFTMGVDQSTVTARYSFVYRRNDDQDAWKICHHHSSILPEAALAALEAQQKSERHETTDSVAGMN